MHKTSIFGGLVILTALPFAALADPAMKGDVPATGSEATPTPSPPAQTGNTTGVKPSDGSSSGTSGSATSPQENSGNGPNLPPSKRVDPENPASPGVNGTDTK